MEEDLLDRFRQTLRAEGALTLEIKVVPSASGTEVAEIAETGTLNIKLQALPEEGKTNTEPRNFLAQIFAASQGR